MVPDTHPLAGVRDSFNAVFVQGAAVGDLMLYGRGAGGAPTASAVLGDVIDAAANLRKGSHASIGHLGKAVIRPIDEVRTAFYLNLDVVDRPGVLRADIAAYFGGRLIGGPRLWPSVSPGKTWAGAIIGALAGAILGLMLAGWTIGSWRFSASGL